MLTASFRKAILQLTILVAVVCCSCSSKPFINSFSVTPLVITEGDSVQLDMDVNGKPSLVYHERKLSDSVKLIEFTLAVRNKGRDSSRRVQVEQRSAQTFNSIEFNTSSLSANKDTIIAAGIKDQRWSGFEVIGVSSASARELVVVHENRTAVLSKDGTSSNAFASADVSGAWTLKALLTAEEKADITKAPGKLKINLTIKSKKQ